MPLIVIAAMRSICHVASLRRPACHRMLVLAREPAQAGAAGEPAGIPEIRNASDKPRKDGPLAWRDARDEIGGGPGSARGLPWFRRMGPGGRCMLGLACRLK